MSAWARSWAYEQRVGETVNGKWRKNPGAKAVLAAICEFPDQDGRCYVGQNTLAQMTDMGVRTVRTHLSFLEANGWIERAERRRADGTRTSDYIWVLAPPERLRPPEPADVQPAKSAASQPSTNATTGKSRHINRRDLTHQPANLAGPYIDDPSEDPLGDPSEEERARETPLPDDTTTQCLLTLKKVKGIGKDYGELAILLGELREEFPQVDAVATVKEYELFHRRPPKPTKNHALKLRTFFKNAEKWRDDSAPKTNGSKKAEKDYSWLEAQMRGEHL